MKASRMVESSLALCYSNRLYPHAWNFHNFVILYLILPANMGMRFLSIRTNFTSLMYRLFCTSCDHHPATAIPPISCYLNLFTGSTTCRAEAAYSEAYECKKRPPAVLCVIGSEPGASKVYLEPSITPSLTASVLLRYVKQKSIRVNLHHLPAFANPYYIPSLSLSTMHISSAAIFRSLRDL